MEQFIFSDCTPCLKCESEGGVSTEEKLNIQFTKNPLWKEGGNFAMPKYSFRIGAYCNDCGAWKKWKKQTPELIEKINKCVLAIDNDI